MTIEFEYPFGNILSERRTTPPDIPTVVDDVVRARFALIQAEFESYTPGKEIKRFRSLLTPKFAFDYRVSYGALLPDETELFMLLSQERSGDKYNGLTKGQKFALSGVFNLIGRNGILTVGALRKADIAAVSLMPTFYKSDRSLVFAQTAVKRLDSPLHH
jgi:hypothetical protein